jgi:hypothetical protein
MRQFFSFVSIAMLGVLAEFGMADAAAGYGLTPLFYECTGFVGGCVAGAAAVI